MNFCQDCGNKVRKLEYKYTRFYCDNCKKELYVNQKPSVCAIVTHKDKILLLKRRYEPFKSMWSLPSGFMEYEETPIDAIIREVKEETGIDIIQPKLVTVYSIYDDPRSNILMSTYTAEAKNDNVIATHEAEECRFFEPRELVKTPLIDSTQDALDFWAIKEIYGAV